MTDSVISGYDVKNVTLTKKKEKNNYVYEMFAEGDVLKQILMIDEVDSTKTYSNNINEILKVLGVEAARKAIINEIQKTIKVHSLNIDKRHIILVADILTSRGRLFGSTR